MDLAFLVSLSDNWAQCGTTYIFGCWKFSASLVNGQNDSLRHIFCLNNFFCIQGIVSALWQRAQRIWKKILLLYIDLGCEPTLILGFNYDYHVIDSVQFDITVNWRCTASSIFKFTSHVYNFVNKYKQSDIWTEPFILSAQRKLYLLQTGIMAEYPVMSTSQDTCVRIEQTSEAIRVTYVLGGALGLELRTADLHTACLLQVVLTRLFIKARCRLLK